MEKEVKEKKTITTDVVIGQEIYCDECGRLIFRKKNKQIVYCIGDYWELTTGHHDWGNDSIDSIEYFDLCSKECCTTRFKDYIQCCQGTKYFELEHQVRSRVNADHKEWIL